MARNTRYIKWTEKKINVPSFRQSNEKKKYCLSSKEAIILFRFLANGRDILNIQSLSTSLYVDKLDIFQTNQKNVYYNSWRWHWNIYIKSVNCFYWILNFIHHIPTRNPIETTSPFIQDNTEVSSDRKRIYIEQLVQYGQVILNKMSPVSERA